MIRVRRLLGRIRRALTSADAFAAAGIACLAVGAGMAWLPLGFLSLGALLLLIARSEAD